MIKVVNFFGKSSATNQETKSSCHKDQKILLSLPENLANGKFRVVCETPFFLMGLTGRLIP